MILKYEVHFFQFSEYLHFDYYVPSLLWDDWIIFSTINDRVRNTFKGQDEEYIISISKDYDIGLNIDLSQLTLDWCNLQTEL